MTSMRWVFFFQSVIEDLHWREQFAWSIHGSIMTIFWNIGLSGPLTWSTIISALVTGIKNISRVSEALLTLWQMENHLSVADYYSQTKSNFLVWEHFLYCNNGKSSGISVKCQVSSEILLFYLSTNYGIYEVSVFSQGSLRNTLAH